MPSIDKDLGEKLIFQRLLWHKKRFGLIDIPVITYRKEKGELKKDEVTDVDVLAINYDETLTKSLEVVDCKSSTVSHNRLLWLKGLQAYLKASHAHFVSRKITARFPEVSRRLGVSIWRMGDIEELLLEQGSPKFDFLFTEMAYSEFKSELKSIKGKKPKIYTKFITTDYWSLEPRNRMQSLIYNFSHIVKDIGESKSHRILVFDSLVKLSLAVLDVSSFVVKNGRKDLHKLCEIYLYGSPEEIRQKREIMSLKGGGESDFYPDYYKNLLDLVGTFVRRSDCSCEVSRLLYEVLFETHFFQEEVSSDKIKSKYNDLNLSLKLSKDLILFFCLATGFSKDYFRDFLEL
mgnify:CR=1 FL=1